MLRSSRRDGGLHSGDKLRLENGTFCRGSHPAWVRVVVVRVLDLDPCWERENSGRLDLDPCGEREKVGRFGVGRLDLDPCWERERNVRVLDSAGEENRMKRCFQKSHPRKGKPDVVC